MRDGTQATSDIEGIGLHLISMHRQSKCNGSFFSLQSRGDHAQCECLIPAYEWAEAQIMEKDRRNVETLLQRFDMYAGKSNTLYNSYRRFGLPKYTVDLMYYNAIKLGHQNYYTVNPEVFIYSEISSDCHHLPSLFQEWRLSMNKIQQKDSKHLLFGWTWC